MPIARAPGGQHVRRSGGVVTDGHGRVVPEEDRACVGHPGDRSGSGGDVQVSGAIRFVSYTASSSSRTGIRVPTVRGCRGRSPPC